MLPGIRSVLMDEQTLLRFKELIVHEPTQHSDVELNELTPSERAVFDGLRSGLWGPKVRLEQERIPWSIAFDAVQAALKAAVVEASGETQGALVSVDEAPPRLSQAEAKELRIRDLEQIFNEQIGASEILNEEALQRRVEDLLFEIDQMLQESQRRKDPHWWRFADLRDDLVDVLRAVRGERLPR